MTVMLAIPPIFSEMRPSVDGGRERSRKGDEWRAIAAESEVGGAEIGDGGDAGASGDDGAFADLESGGGWCSEVGHGFPLMENGLAVVADEIDFARRDAEFLQAARAASA